MTILGLILAGGHSSRMGRDKAALEFCGRSLIENQISTLKKHELPVAVSSNTLEESSLPDIPILPDPADVKYGGPLAGIYAGLCYGHDIDHSYVLTMPVDCPIVPEDFFTSMTKDLNKNDGFRIAATSSGLQPTFALWPTSLKDELFKFLVGSKNNSIRSFAFAHNVSIVRFDNVYSEGAFFNVNTPEDYRYLQKKFGIKDERKA